MRCYLVTENTVTVAARVPAATAGVDIVRAAADLDQARFPVARLVAIWNGLPGQEPVQRFRDRAAAVKRLWAALADLPLGSPDSGSKPDRIVALLQRPAGASLDDLVAATGWQKHSVRGVLSGVIRKKRGLNLTSAREGERRVYRIVP